MSQLDKPNTVVPLAASYNERGVDGYAASVTSVLDQRTVNAIAYPIVNQVSGRSTFYLCKRPGVVDNGNTWGTSGQVGYSVSGMQTSLASLVSITVWVFSVSGTDIRVSDTSGTTAILTAALTIPAWVDVTLISGTPTTVLQTRAVTTGAQRAWYASARNAWTEITDANFTALKHVGKIEHLDGFALILDASNRIWNSNLNTLATWSATGFTTKQIEQDAPQGLIRHGNLILAGGVETIEVFHNAGNATGSPLETVPQMVQNIGIAAPPTGAPYAKRIGTRTYFIGKLPGNYSSTPSAGIYAFDGGRVEKVSSNAVDKIISGTTGGAYGLYALTVLGQEALAVMLNATTATTARWLMFFPEWKVWYEWNSTTFFPANDYGFCLGVGSNQHKLYNFQNTDVWQDAGTNYDRVVQFKLPSNGGNSRKRMYWCGLEQTIERSACNELVEFSDDDGQTWQTGRNIDCTLDKPHIYRGGSFKQRLVRLTNSTNHERRIENFLARID